VPWRYGTVLRYRRRDIEDGAAAFGAWMTARRNAVRDVDPARSLRRRQQRGRAQASRQMIIDALQSQLAAAEQLPPPQAGLGVVAIWFDRLISYHEAISAVKARSRSHGRALAARRSGLAVPLEAAAEFLVGRAIAGEPHLRATICGGGRIVFCPTCAAAARRARIARADGFGIPGCPDCLIDNASLGVFLEIDLPGLYTLFETDLATASAWSHLGPRDDVRAPSRLFAQEAAAGLPVTNSGYVLCQPPGISDAVWRAADRDTRMALWQTWQESVRAARLAGELPTEILPRHITGLARSRDWIRGPISSYRPPADRRARQVLPEARLIEQLAGALAAYSGNAFILGRA